jgi:hypothetical protein
MKALVAVLVGLAVAVSAHVAAAYVVVVATAVPITSAATADRTQLGNAVQSAIRDVLDHAIGFTPTVVTLQNAKVVGDRLYLLLFIADEDGESTIDTLSGGGASQSKPGNQGSSDSPAPSEGVPILMNTPGQPISTMVHRL